MIPLIVWLTDKFGWRVALVVLGLGIWVLGVPVIAVVRNRPVSTEGVQELGGDGTQSAASGKSPEMSFHEVLRTWIFWYINIADVIRMIAVTAIVTHIMPYLEGMGVPRTTAVWWLRQFFGRRSFGKVLGVTLGAASIGGVAGPTLAGWGYDVLGNYQVVWVVYCALLGLAVVPIMRLKR